MDTQILKVVGQTAGIGGLALGVFLLLFRQLLQRIRPAGLTRVQWYRVIIIFMLLVWSLALAGLAVWIIADRAGRGSEAFKAEGSMVMPAFPPAATPEQLSTPVASSPGPVSADLSGQLSSAVPNRPARASTAVSKQLSSLVPGAASSSATGPSGTRVLRQSSSFSVGRSQGSIDITAELGPDGTLVVRYRISEFPSSQNPTHFLSWNFSGRRGSGVTRAAPEIVLEDANGVEVFRTSAPAISCFPGSHTSAEQRFTVPQSSNVSRIKLGVR